MKKNNVHLFNTPHKRQKTKTSILLSCPSDNFFPICGRMPLPALSLWPGRQPCRPRLVDDRIGGGPSSVAPRCLNPPADLRITVFARPTPVRSRLRASQQSSPLQPA